MNGLDGIFILTILLLAFWGFKIGLIGATIWLIAAYVSVVLSAQIVGWTIPRFGLPENLTSISTSIGYILVSAAVFMVARFISLSIRSGINVTPLRWVNDFGGALMGFILGVFAVVGFIAIAATLTYVVPEGALDYGGVSYSESFSQVYLASGPRAWLDQQLTGSLFVEIVASLRPVIVPFAPRELGIAVDVLFSRVD